MKLWQKSTSINERIAEFTVGKDRELDRVLAPFDILGSIAHITMLHSIGLLETSDLKELKKELSELYPKSKKGELIIETGIEDIHSQVEFLLTKVTQGRKFIVGDQEMTKYWLIQKCISDGK